MWNNNPYKEVLNVRSSSAPLKYIQVIYYYTAELEQCYYKIQVFVSLFLIIISKQERTCLAESIHLIIHYFENPL